VPALSHEVRSGAVALMRSVTTMDRRFLERLVKFTNPVLGEKERQGVIALMVTLFPYLRKQKIADYKKIVAILSSAMSQIRKVDGGDKYPGIGSKLADLIADLCDHPYPLWVMAGKVDSFLLTYPDSVLQASAWVLILIILAPYDFQIEGGLEKGVAEEFLNSNLSVRKAWVWAIMHNNCGHEGRKIALSGLIEEVSCPGEQVLLSGEAQEATDVFGGIEYREMEAVKKAVTKYILGQLRS